MRSMRLWKLLQMIIKINILKNACNEDCLQFTVSAYYVERKEILMYEFSIHDLRRAAYIGQRTTIKLHKGSEIRGILTQICLEYLCIRDIDTGLEISVPSIDIKNLIFDGYSKKLKINSIEMSKFKRQCERLAEEANITIGYFFSSDIKSYANNCINDDLKSYLLSEIQNKAGKFTIGEYEEFYEYLLSEKKHSKEDKKAFDIISILMLFRMRKYNNAVTYAVGLLEKKNLADVALVMTCLFTQMKNHMEALFWLERYYLLERNSTTNWDNIWWFYLKMISKYSSYEKIECLLKNMAEISSRTAIESLSYLLLANNSVNIATQLLDRVDEYLTHDEAIELIERNCSFLISDQDNNYHRFVRCIDNILDKGLISEYDDSEDITGYIFDYVPDREFGFALGFDLIVYFFRKESIHSNNVNKHIKDNICSMLSVNEEDLVSVTFKRSLESKRSYNAIDIV